MDHGREIAKRGLEIGAIKFNFENPFTWASGFRMPIYNDNRLFLANPRDRRMISNGFKKIIDREDIQYKVIAGTSTAGISPATTLADSLFSPMIYVRDKPKEHGLRNSIEGIDAGVGLEGRKVILIEDLISTGGSSAKAVQAIRDAGGECGFCLSIFNYGFTQAEQMFKGEIPYDKENARFLETCQVISLLTYDVLIDVEKEEGYVTEEQVKMLDEWRTDPFGWGEKRGFARVIK